MTRHLGTMAALGWQSTGDTVGERVHLLGVPLREPRPASDRATYRVQSLDRTVVQTYTVGAGAHELVGLVQFDDDPQSLLDCLRAGAEGKTLTYYPDVRDPDACHACTLMSPTGDQLAVAAEQARKGFGNATVEVRLRRTDQKPLVPADQNSAALLWYRGGGSLERWTFARATAATRIDKGRGQYAAVVSGQAVTDWVDVDGDGIREMPALRLSRAVTNLCLRSEDFGTLWTAIGSPTRSAAALTCGTLTLDLLGDDAAGAAEGYYQDITFTADAVKAVAIHLAAGTATQTGLQLEDTTAGVSRLIALVTWTAGVPSVGMTTGTHLGTEALTNGIYRLLFQTTSVTAANTNRLRVYPAGFTVGNTGDGYAGGVSAENSPAPGPYVASAGTSGTRNADSLTCTFGGRPQAMTVYLRFVERGTILEASTTRLFQLGSASDPRFIVMTNGTYYRAHYDAGASTVESVAATAPALGDVVELMATLTSAGVVQLTQCLNGGTPATASASSALALPAAWGAAAAHLGGYAGSAAGNAQFLNAVVVRGVRTLDEMRRLAKT